MSLQPNHSLKTNHLTRFQIKGLTTINNKDAVITVVIIMKMIVIIMTRMMMVTAVITMMMTKHKARQTSDSKTDYNIVHYMLRL